MMNHVPLWRRIQQQNFTKIDEIIQFLELDAAHIAALDCSPDFVLQLPRRLAEKIQKRTVDDPLFKQFIPLKQEKESYPGFVQDPVQDARFRKAGKLLHKYAERALIVTTGACPMHCRFCFRKNFPYKIDYQSFEKEIAYLKSDSTLSEVLLSGGDPLSLSDATLEHLMNEIAAIDHVQRIRFHTRFPIGIPERIDAGFLTLLEKCSKQIWFIIHTNHKNEFDDAVWMALKKIQMLGIPVLSQTVLLKGVNDSVDALKELMEALINHGVMPYYLHQLDRVQGSGHFEVPPEQGLALIDALLRVLPGYAIPRYVQEVPGMESKTRITTLPSAIT